MSWPLHILHVHSGDAVVAHLAALLPTAAATSELFPLHPNRWCDGPGVWRLRQRIFANPPDVVQAWGPAAVLAVWLVGRPTGTHTVASVSTVPTLTRWLLPYFDRVTVPGIATQTALGLPATPLPLSTAPILNRDRSEVLHAVGLPPDARFVLVAGARTRANGLRPALYAFDLLRYVYPDVHLLIAGTDPDRAKLLATARSLAGPDLRTHLTAHPVAELVPHASVVWVPNQQDGVELTQQSVTAGVPTFVVARPELIDAGAGQARVLTPGPRMHAELASRTREVLLSPPASARERCVFAIGDRGSVGSMVRDVATEVVPAVPMGTPAFSKQSF